MSYGIRIKYLLILSIALIFCTGCQIRLPVFVADDSSVRERMQDGFLETKALSGTTACHLKRSSKEQAYVLDSQGSFRGLTSDKFEFSFDVSGVLTEGVSDNQASDQVSKYMVLDIKEDRLYEQTDKDWMVYLDAMSMVDLGWWTSLFASESFGYDGTGALNGQASGYLLSASFRGDMIDDILDHLHIDLGGSFDSGEAELEVHACLDKKTGILHEIRINLADNGALIQILDDAGVLWKLEELELSVLFDDIDQDVSFDIQIPEHARSITPVSPSADMVVESDGLSDKTDLISSDKKWSVVFHDDRVFDDIQVSKKGIMTAKSSGHIAGDPMVTIKYVNGSDAYNSVIADQQVALEYYNQEQALSEVYVSEKVTGSTMNGHMAYSYLQQYSDMSYGFVNTDHCTYVDLGADQYLSIRISSMVDLGVSTVLTEDYAKSILKNIEIKEV